MVYCDGITVFKIKCMHYCNNTVADDYSLSMLDTKLDTKKPSKLRKAPMKMADRQDKALTTELKRGPEMNN